MTATDPFGGTGAPTQTDTANPKDTNTLQPLNLSSVTGMVVHTEGNLMLVRRPMEPAMGNGGPTPPTLDKTFAVVRLPDGCNAVLSDGAQVTAQLKR